MSARAGSLRERDSQELGVVIVTRDRRDSLRHTLSRLAALSADAPVVVVDNGSNDGSPDVVRGIHPNAQLTALSRDAGPAARTIGAEALDTPLVAFCDDDSWWAPTAFARARELFRAHPRLGLIGARILVGPEESLDPTCVAMRDSPLRRERDLPGPSVLGFVACGAIVRRSAFLASGGFSARFDFGGEEELLALDLAAAGWGLSYVDAVVAHHHPATSSRHRTRRARAELLNGLWTTWLRRRPAGAARTTAWLARKAVQRGEAGVLLDAARGLGWVRHERRPVPRSVECAARAIER